MTWDLIGWSEATPGTGQNPIAAGLVDQFMRQNADGDAHIIFPKHQWCLGIFASATSTGEEVRLRQTGLNNDHQFFKVQLIVNTDPVFGFTDLQANPLPLRPDTSLWADVVNATDEAVLVGAMVGSGKVTRAMKDTVTPAESLHGVGDTTQVAYTWTPCAITWDQTPDQGKYAIVGMRAGVNAAAALNATLMRLVIPGALTYRPGVPCAYMGADHEEYQGVSDEPWYHWNQMNEVSFIDTQMPNVETLSPGVNTDQNVEILIVRIGDR